MDKKKLKDLSNNELMLYKKELSNEFDITQSKIEKLCEHLKELDNEYRKTENELKIRGSNIY